MREEYDFSQARKNPYAAKLKRQITINIDGSTIDYFKEQSAASAPPITASCIFRGSDGLGIDISAGIAHNAEKR